MEIHPLLTNYAVATHGKPHLLIFEREDNTWQGFPNRIDLCGDLGKMAKNFTKIIK